MKKTLQNFFLEWKLLFLVAFATAVLAGSFFWVGAAASTKKGETLRTLHKATIATEIRPRTPDHRIDEACNNRGLYIGSFHLLSGKDLMLPLGLVGERTDIPELLRRSHDGKETPAVTLFFIVQACAPYRDYLDTSDIVADDIFSVKQEICAKVPEHLIFDPLSVLEPAARMGSVRAQVLFAKNAPITQQFRSFAHTNLPPTERGDVLRRAELFALSAARSGAVPAYLSLADGYQSGLFGEKDPARAYALTAALASASGTSEFAPRLDYLYRDLTRGDLAKAHALLASCHRQEELSSESLRSPF